jgi:hypothetical protein
MTKNSLTNIINTINKIDTFDILLNKINIYSNKIYNSFNNNIEQIQTDFIKAIYIKYKLLSEEINYDNHFYNLLPFIKFTNINTIKHLLHWSCNNNEYMLCEYILLHKKVIIPNNEYELLENKAVELNKDFVFLFTQHRINDTYNDSYNSDSNEGSEGSDGSDNTDNTDSFDETDSSDETDTSNETDSSDSSSFSNSSDEDNYDYKKVTDIN